MVAAWRESGVVGGGFVIIRGMPDVFVAGVGMTRVGRRSEPLPELMAEAAHAALAEAGLDVP